MQPVLFFALFLGLCGNSAFATPASSDAPISTNLKLVAVADGKSFFADKTIKRTWFEARSYCEDMGMTFASITSQAQADALKAAYSATDFHGDFWTSGRDSHLRRQFTWDSTGDAIPENYTDMWIRDDYPFQSCLLHHSFPSHSSLRKAYPPGVFLTWWYCSTPLGTLCTV